MMFGVTPVKTALIGLGYWGPNLLRNFSAQHECDLAVACDLSPANIDKARRHYPAVKYVMDVRDVWNDPSIELVLIATPTSTHYPLAKAALESGKHVFVEKPMTSTVAQAEELVALAKSKGKQIFVDHTFVFAPAVRKLREIAKNGTLGDLLYFDSSRINLGLIQRDTNVLYDLAIHDLSILSTVMDLDQVAQVTSMGSMHFGAQEEHVHLHIHFESGFHAHIQVSWLSPVKVRRSVLAGRKGMAIYDDTEPSEKLRVYDSAVEHDESKPDPMLPKYRSGDILIPALPVTETLGVEAAHIMKAVRGLERAEVSGEDALKILRILEKAQESMRSGGVPVTL
jgi:predicted dehydrogenase